MTEENKTFMELDEQARVSFDKRNETLRTIDELTRSYEQGVTARQNLRRETGEKLKEFSDGKVNTFNALKKVVQNIEIYEKNKNKIYRKLTVLNSRKEGVVDIYKVLIHGGMPKREDLEKPIFESYLKLYDEVFAPIMKASDDDITAMFSKKDDYMSGINLFFSRLQEDVHDIDSEMKRLLELEVDIDKKLTASRTHQEKLQKNYEIFTECIKNSKMELGAFIRDERELLADFDKLLTDLTALSVQSENVQQRLGNSLEGASDVLASDVIEDVEDVVDEHIEKDAEEIDNAALQVQEEKKSKTIEKTTKKSNFEESILAPAVDAEKPEKSNGRGKRDSILSSMGEEETNLDELLKKDSGMMLKHDEHLLLDLSEILQ